MDVDRLRDIILALQKKAAPAPATWPNASAVGPEFATLAAARLVDLFDDSHMGESPHRVLALTASGQLFSELIRDDAAWNDTKQAIRAEGSPLTIESLKARLLRDDTRKGSFGE